MIEKINRIARHAGTDISGKWVATHNVEIFADKLINDVIRELRLNGYDDAAKTISEYYQLEYITLED